MLRKLEDFLSDWADFLIRIVFPILFMAGVVVTLVLVVQGLWNFWT